jgi:hypothetical protein
MAVCGPALCSGAKYRRLEITFGASTRTFRLIECCSVRVVANRSLSNPDGAVAG